MASRFKKLAVTSLWIGILGTTAFIAFSPRNKSPGASHIEHREEPQQQEAAASVSFTSPLYTKSGALVCPFSIASDRREGYGLKAAMEAHLSLFGHEDAVEKLGCQEWREGLPVELTTAGKTQAEEWKQKNTAA